MHGPLIITIYHDARSSECQICQVDVLRGMSTDDKQ
jgi:hypothetical protein